MSSPERSRVFASLSERNVRIFFAGLGISNVGTWAQTTAVVLLVTRLGGEGLEIGLAVAAQFLPVLLLGLVAGSIALMVAGLVSVLSALTDDPVDLGGQDARQGIHDRLSGS